VTTHDLLGPLRRLAGAGTAQVLSSLSNVVIVIAMGRGGGAAGLGRYTLAFGAYLIVLGFCRALVSQPLLTLREKIEAHDETVKASATAVACLGLGGGAVSVLVGLGLRSPEFIAVGLLMVPLCVQDLLRYAFFQTDRPWRATLLDGIWLLVSLAAFPIISSHESPTIGIVLWAAGALLGAVPGLVILGVRAVSPARAYRWWRLHARQLGVGLVLENVAYTLGTQASLWVIALLLGGGDLGLLKAGQTILQPAMICLAAFNMVAIPRMSQSARGVSHRSVLLTSGGAILLVGVVSVGLVWLGPPIARIIFGSDLQPGRALLLPVAVQFTANALAVGPVTALMVHQRGGTLAAVRAISAALGLGAVAAVSPSLGITGAAWALALGAFLFTLGTAAVIPADLRRAATATQPGPASRAAQRPSDTQSGEPGQTAPRTQWEEGHADG
jgi:O-antigen/teichoic acid export membrane protein